MTGEVLALTDARAPEWDAFVHETPGASFFHRAGWRRVIADTFGHSTLYLLYSGGGRIAGILPLVHVKSLLFGDALISNAFCVGGGPLGADEEATAALTAAAVQHLERLGADYLEYRDCPSPGADWVEEADVYATFEREIAPEEDTNLKAIPRKQRAVLRKALAQEEAGALRVEVDSATDRFYDLFARNVRSLGTPVFPRSLFRNLRATFGEDCEVLTVEAGDGRPLASVLSFYFRGRVMPYYTGSAPDARRLGANDLMYWRVMRRARERGCNLFDFGRSKVGTGPYDFKKNWGFEPRPVPHHFRLNKAAEIPNLNPLNPKFRLFIAVWRRLPLGFANLLGPRIVKYLG